METGKIYQAINDIMKEVGFVQKQKNANLNYSFASERAFIEALRPVMVNHGVMVHVISHNEVTREEYETKNGTRMINTVIEGVVRFAHVDGSYIDVFAGGEGSDSGDKSYNKAMTDMLKYALRQTFMIETGDDPDKDASVERVKTTSKTVTKLDYSWTNFLETAKAKGLAEADAKAKLKAAGFSKWEDNKSFWDKAVAALA